MQRINDVMRDSRLTMYVVEKARAAGDDGRVIASPLSPAPGACPHCGGAGYVRADVEVGHPQFGKLLKCACRKRKDEGDALEKMQKMSNLRQFSLATFATFDRDVPGTREAYETSVRYSEVWDPMWLVLSGGCGCGKTHLAAAVANATLDRLTVLFAVVPDLLDQLRAAYAPGSDYSFDDRFRAIRDVGMLILDDFGTENTTEWAREKLFQIINYRLNEQLPLVITTNNVRRDKTTGRFIFGGVDDRIASRLSDVRMVKHIHMAADDYRTRVTGYSLPTAPRPHRQY